MGCHNTKAERGYSQTTNFKDVTKIYVFEDMPKDLFEKMFALPEDGVQEITIIYFQIYFKDSEETLQRIVRVSFQAQY